MKNITNITKEPLVIFYQRTAQEHGLFPIDVAQAKKSIDNIKKKISPEVFKNRFTLICKYYNDIADHFIKYKSKYIYPEIVYDRDVLEFIKEKMRRRTVQYQIIYNPALFTWALEVVRNKDINKVKEKLKEVSYEEVKGAILKAYEALEKEGDHFLREVFSLSTKR